MKKKNKKDDFSECLGASLLANLLTGKRQLERMKEQLEHVKNFNSAPSFN